MSISVDFPTWDVMLRLNTNFGTAEEAPEATLSALAPFILKLVTLVGDQINPQYKIL